MQIAVTVVAYEAADTIEGVLDRIPTTVEGRVPWVLISDDASTDNTFDLAEKWAARNTHFEVEVTHQPINLGYGGNQKALYRMAQDRGADIVVLVHGDGQYPPEMVDQIVEPLLVGRAEVVHGSRMILPGGAKRGRMPLDRRIGNRVLSRTFNLLCGSHLSEWFSGFRAYRMDSLMAIPDLYDLPDGFDFDTAITLRLLENSARIAEVAIPTHYGDEISRVPLLRTGLVGLAHVVEHWRSFGRAKHPQPDPSSD